MTTPHEILGVSPEATDTEIRTAYRRAAMQHHPDRGGSAEAFQRVQEAYKALQTRVCAECSGTGWTSKPCGIFVTKEPCTNCWGKGRQE